MATECDVAIIGAGPSGAVAAAMLVRAGHSVKVVERSTFPRFSIGESLLPQCMVMIEDAGLMPNVLAGNHQYKDGADFSWGLGRKARIHFPDKSTEGPSTAFQVDRATFDHALIDGAAAMGAEVLYRTEVTGYTDLSDGAELEVDHEGRADRIRARFVLDASGFGRVLPRLLDLNLPSTEPPRRAIFKHIRQQAWKADFDRNKILIAIHPVHPQVWYWVIPLVDGGVSIGLVGPDELVTAAGSDSEARFQHFTSSMGWETWFDEAEQFRPTTEFAGYASAVRALHGPHFALLGNAGEFLDPIFSSGVTIAVKSSQLATDCLIRQFAGETVDWDADYAKPLVRGVDAFRSCVQAWYDGRLQRIIFSAGRGDNTVTRHLTAILAGYAWDLDNPFVRKPVRFMEAIDHVVSRAG